MSGSAEDGPQHQAPAGLIPAEDDAHDHDLLEITYEVAITSLARIISPSLADFLT